MCSDFVAEEGSTVTVEELRKSDMMAHLLDALDEGKDIGHYGRLVFTMVARHFLDEDELVGYLAKDPDFDEKDVKTLLLEVKAHDYNPPKRNKVLQWQQQQDFPICPNPDDPKACNVYDDLQFPDHIYENIEEYYEEQVEAQGS